MTFEQRATIRRLIADLIGMAAACMIVFRWVVPGSWLAVVGTAIVYASLGYVHRRWTWRLLERIFGYPPSSASRGR